MQAHSWQIQQDLASYHPGAARHRKASHSKQSSRKSFTQGGRNAHSLQKSRCHAYSLSDKQISSPVKVEVEKVAGNTRRLYAGITIQAPIKFVWQALTDYASLHKFIPGLAENTCLQQRAHGARLLQIGEQQIALGAKFRARVILDIEEYSGGVPAHLCSNMTSQLVAFASQGLDLFPVPRSQPADGQPQDIAFSMIEGDFAGSSVAMNTLLPHDWIHCQLKAFKGIWRMQERSDRVTRLTYCLHVQPQRWLPVKLIQSRIEGEVAVNLNAVRIYTEQLSSIQS